MLEDENGFYITYRSRLDSGLADPKKVLLQGDNRWNRFWLGSELETRPEEQEIFASNEHEAEADDARIR